MRAWAFEPVMSLAVVCVCRTAAELGIGCGPNQATAATPPALLRRATNGNIAAVTVLPNGLLRSRDAREFREDRRRGIHRDVSQPRQRNTQPVAGFRGAKPSSGKAL
jgi:hypothetical protein